MSGDTTRAPGPLSFNQQALYFEHQTSPESAALNLGVAGRIRSRVDPEAMHQALQALIDRHESLRTTYHASDDAPQQVVGDERVHFEVIDVRDYSEASLQNRVDAEYRRPFDLEHGPVFRAKLFTRSSVDHVLLMSVHHIAADGASMWNLANELRILYEAFSCGLKVELPPVSPYREFVERQQALLASDQGERLWDYWRGQLADLPEPLVLPWDRRQSATYGHGDSEPLRISDDLSNRLKSLARERGTTLFCLLMAAWQVFLFRHTGQTDLLVGTPAWGRGRRDLEGAVGAFMNTIVVRGDLSNDPAFTDLLASLRKRLFSAVRHADFPFSILIHRLGVKREPGRPPLVQTLFLFQKPPRTDLVPLLVPEKGARAINFGGLVAEPFVFFQQEDFFDLTLELLEIGDSLTGALKYRTDRFDRTTISQMCRRFGLLLEQIVADPGQTVGNLALLPSDERQRVLVAWNKTAESYSADVGIHTLIEASAARAPNSPAIFQHGRTTSYKELNSRANRLAARLRKRGVTPGVVVGVGLNRTPDLVATLLGVLKVGGAYVPLDPDFPEQRLAWMLEDASPLLLITERALANRWPPAVPVLCLDDESERLEEEPTTNLPDVGDGNIVAYTIFTSGSTGRPKGIDVPRRAVINLFLDFRRRFGLTDADRIVAVSTLSFDIAVVELLLPLTVGASIVLATREEALDPRRLTELLTPDVTLMQATCTTWRMLCDFGWPGLPSVRALCGGETLSADLATQLLSRTREVWNLYGPTETTVWSTAERVTTVDSITIGRPIANTRAYVLGPNRQPVPTGVAGELWIAGDGVARGYHGRPDLTAERFVQDPFAPAGRMYRTGDLARWLLDGRLEHLGRIDLQVKVRGFRIELTEIEAALRELAGISDAVAVAQRHDGTQILVAHAVRRDSAVTSEAVRTALRSRLPNYMVPDHIVWHDSLPVAPTGKVDRRTLAEWTSGSVTRARYEPPRTALEETLVAIWSELLGRSDIGIRDSFFDLGGHSILATQFVSRLRLRHGITLATRLVFEAPTIEQLAALVDHISGPVVRPISGVEREYLEF